MNTLGIILFWVFVLAELAYWLLYLGRRRKKGEAVRRSLYKLLEERVLVKTLQERISSEAASQEELRKIFLYVEFPDTKPLLMRLFSLNECITIGRSRENIICIRDGMLSRMHCKIYETNGYLVLQDMGTANGTKIRRGIFRTIRLDAGQQEYLCSGDRIRLGNYRMKIKIFHGWEAGR